MEPQSEQPAPGETPVIQASPAPAQQSSGGKLKKLLLALLVLVLFGGGGTAAWFLTRPAKKADTKTQPTSKTSTNKLLYAYQEGDRTTIKEFDPQKNTTGDFFSYDEYHKPDNNDFYAQQVSSVALSPDGKSLAYSSKTGLYIRPLANPTDKTQLIKATGTPDSIGTAYTYVPALTTKNGPDGIYGMSDVEWSVDGKAISFGLGQYEGVTANAIDIATKTYSTATDTFRYISEGQVLGKNFIINSKNKSFLTMGVLPSYVLLPEDFLNSPQYSPDKSHIYAILCAPNLPTTGDLTYDASGDASIAGLDCGEPTDNRLVSISTTDGSYEEIAHSRYDTSMSISDGTAYISSKDLQVVYAVDLLSGSSSLIDTTYVGAIPSSHKVIANIVSGTRDAFSTVYHQDGNNYFATVVDLKTQTRVGDFKVDKNTFLLPLALR